MNRLSIVVLVLAAALVACGSPSSPPPSSPPSPSPTASPAPVQAAPPPAPLEPPAQARTQPRKQVEPSPVAAAPAPAAPAPAAPAPAAPAPAATIVAIPAGTPMEVIFLDGLSSETSQLGDTFRARLAQDVTHNGLVVLPAGSIVRGEVTEVVALKKIGGTAKLGLRFSAVELSDGTSVPIDASISQQGKSETKKDAATIGGAAAGGAVLGKILGKGSKDALIGAVVGAAAGTAIAAKTKGEQVEVPVGTELPIELNRSVEVSVRR